MKYLILTMLTLLSFSAFAQVNVKVNSVNANTMIKTELATSGMDMGRNQVFIPSDLSNALSNTRLLHKTPMFQWNFNVISGSISCTASSATNSGPRMFGSNVISISCTGTGEVEFRQVLTQVGQDFPLYATAMIQPTYPTVFEAQLRLYKDSAISTSKSFETIELAKTSKVELFDKSNQFGSSNMTYAVYVKKTASENITFLLLRPFFGISTFVHPTVGTTKDVTKINTRATKINEGEVLLENQNNLIRDPGFEQNPLDTSVWKTRTVSGTATCTLETGASDPSKVFGNRSLLSTCSGDGVAEIYQDVSTNGTEMSSEIFLSPSNANGALYLRIYDGSTLIDQVPLEEGTNMRKVSTTPFKSSTTFTTFAIAVVKQTGSGNVLVRGDSSFLGHKDFNLGQIKNVSNMKSYGPLNLIGSTTNPTKGTIVKDDLSCFQDGEFWNCFIQFEQSTAGTAGAGDYSIRLPNELLATGIEPTARCDTRNIGTIQLLGAGAQPTAPNSYFCLWSENSIRLLVIQSSTIGNFQSPSWYGFNSNPLAFSGWIRFKGKGLRSTVDIISENTPVIKAGELKILTDGETCPKTTTIPDGRSVLKTNYPELWSVYGNRHGDGSTTPAGTTADVGCPHATNCFNLPRMTGGFTRLFDPTGTIDPDSATRLAANAGGLTGNKVGTLQSFQVQSHRHGYTIGRGNDNAGGIPNPEIPLGDGQSGAQRLRDVLSNRSDSKIHLEGGLETRPKNTSVLGCIYTKSLVTVAPIKAENIFGLERYIVKKYKSGNDWYEINNDCWVRQRKYVPTGTGGTITVTHTIPMADSSYSVTGAMEGSGGTTGISSLAIYLLGTKTSTKLDTQRFVDIAKDITIEGYGSKTALQALGVDVSKCE